MKKENQCCSYATGNRNAVSMVGPYLLAASWQAAGRWEWDACSSDRSDGCAGRRRTGTLPLSRHKKRGKIHAKSAEDVTVCRPSLDQSETWDLTQFKVTVEHCFAAHVVLVGDSLRHAVIVLEVGAVDGADERLTQMQLIDLMSDNRNTWTHE